MSSLDIVENLLGHDNLWAIAHVGVGGTGGMWGWINIDALTIFKPFSTHQNGPTGRQILVVFEYFYVTNYMSLVDNNLKQYLYVRNLMSLVNP